MWNFNLGLWRGVSDSRVAARLRHMQCWINYMICDKGNIALWMESMLHSNDMTKPPEMKIEL